MDASAGTTTRYYYDDQRVAVQTRVSGGVESDFRYYVFGNYIDEVLVMGYRYSTSWIDFYYGYDHLYSPVALFAANGTVVERYEYDAYGKCQILTSAFSPLTSSQYGNPYTFTGRELDILDAGTLRLMYYRARTYDPETGRFIQRDPLGYVDGLNLYEYTKSCPLIYVDSLGTVSESISVTWEIFNATGQDLFGRNSIEVILSADSEDDCRFGKPKLNRSQTHRLLWSGKLLSETGPTFYRKKVDDNCCENEYYVDCYTYSVEYKWYSGVPKPKLPPFVPWPFEYWMITEITIDICADGETSASASNSGSSHHYTAK